MYLRQEANTMVLNTPARRDHQFSFGAYVVWSTPSFRQGSPESSHMDVNLRIGSLLLSSTYGVDKLPSVALDFGIPAGMTTLQAKMRIADVVIIAVAAFIIVFKYQSF